MVLRDKTDEQLIKEIKKLWFKRTGELGTFSILSIVFYWLWFGLLIYRFNSFIKPLIILIVYGVFMYVFAKQKKKYYNQPHIYERNTRDLWEYKRELECRGYEVKVIRLTEITNGKKRVYDNLKIIKKEV